MSRDAAATAGHRLLPHTADVILEAWGPTRATCLEEVVRGAVGTYADTTGVPAGREVPVAVAPAGGDGADELVVALVEELLYLLDAEGLVAVDVTLHETADGGVEGVLAVAPVSDVRPTGAVPKGASRSDLSFARDGDLWRAQVLLDV